MNYDEVVFPKAGDWLVLYGERMGGNQHNPPYSYLSVKCCTSEEEAEEFAEQCLKGEDERTALVLPLNEGRVFTTSEAVIKMAEAGQQIRAVVGD